MAMGDRVPAGAAGDAANDPGDPGDPFTPGSRRFEARAQLLAALEDLLVNLRSDGDRLRRARDDFPLLDAVLAAHKQWALFGRDGE